MENVAHNNLSDFDAKTDVIEAILSSYRPTNERSFEVVDIFKNRLDPGDIERIEKAVEDNQWSLPPHSQKRFRDVELLRYGVHLLKDISKKTGLVSKAPPKDIHNMHNLDIDVGSLYDPNLILEILKAAGSQILREGRYLDFGCSSGRVIRTMQAAFPGSYWYGCDPERSAIRWAQSEFPSINFFPMEQEPPLPFGASFFSMVYAIGIWSHYREDMAIAWLNEMHRIIKPGGYLFLTTHSQQSLAQWHHNGLMKQEQLDSILYRLLTQYYVFEDSYRETGDWSADTGRWGMTYIHPQWFLNNTLDHWKIVCFRQGYLQWNQDVYLLEKRNG